MRVEVNMTTTEDKFYSASWWAGTPDFFIESLRKQLDAATAIWPELAHYQVAKKRDRSKAAGQH